MSKEFYGFDDEDFDIQEDRPQMPPADNTCYAGFPLPPHGKPCPECGAKLGDTCGRVGSIPSKKAHELAAIRAELAQARADLAERDAKLAVVMGALEVVEKIAFSIPAPNAYTPQLIQATTSALATLPEQAKRLMEVVEAAWAVKNRKAHTLDQNLRNLSEKLSNLSRPDGDGR